MLQPLKRSSSFSLSGTDHLALSSARDIVETRFSIANSIHAGKLVSSRLFSPISTLLSISLSG